MQEEEECLEEEEEEEECPLCYEKLPLEMQLVRYKECCGRTQCMACQVSQLSSAGSKEALRACAFCRAPEASTRGEYRRRLERRADLKDARAAFLLYVCLTKGACETQIDLVAGSHYLDLAADLGHPDALFDKAFALYAQKDLDKAQFFFEKVVKSKRALGHDVALGNLGSIHYDKGNYERAAYYSRKAAIAGLDSAMADYEDIFRKQQQGIIIISTKDLLTTRNLFHIAKQKKKKKKAPS